MPDDQNNQQDFDETDDDAKHQAAKSPAVKDEENIFTGDQPESGADYDIDDALKAVGRPSDRDGIHPLGDQSVEEEF